MTWLGWAQAGSLNPLRIPFLQQTAPLPSNGPFLEKLLVEGVGASGLNKNQFYPHFRDLPLGRRKTDMVTGREGVWEPTDPLCFSSQLELGIKQKGKIHFPIPTIARSAVVLGSMVKRGAPGTSSRATAYMLPRRAPPAQCGPESQTAQPRASLSDATAKHQTTYRAFPENQRPQAELQACN